MSDSRPSMKAVGLAQNQEGNVRRQAAARRYYADAKLLHFLGTTISALLALAVPLVFWLWPGGGVGLGALAGAWIFISRLVLVPLRDRRQLQGALAQEMFDRDVLALGWSPALGDPLANEDILGTAARAEKKTGSTGRAAWSTGDWYPTGSDATWPMSVLICQRANAVWARRQHGGYGWVLAGLAASWGIVGIVIGLVGSATLATYLTTIALPSLPALLDASEEARAHFRASAARQRLESAINQEVGQASTDASRLRAFQDQIFHLRRAAPLVPDWFYRLRRSRLDADMRGAAEEMTRGEARG
jgi:SMODS-associating 4TM effector domain